MKNIALVFIFFLIHVLSYAQNEKIEFIFLELPWSNEEASLQKTLYDVFFIDKEADPASHIHNKLSEDVSVLSLTLTQGGNKIICQKRLIEGEVAYRVLFHIEKWFDLQFLKANSIQSMLYEILDSHAKIQPGQIFERDPLAGTLVVKDSKNAIMFWPDHEGIRVRFLGEMDKEFLRMRKPAGVLESTQDAPELDKSLSDAIEKTKIYITNFSNIDETTQHIVSELKSLKLPSYNRVQARRLLAEHLNEKLSQLGIENRIAQMKSAAFLDLLDEMLRSSEQERVSTLPGFVREFLLKGIKPQFRSRVKLPL